MSLSPKRVHDEVTRIVDAIGQGGGGGGASTWEQLTNKPFNTLNTDDFEVDNGELKIKLDGANVKYTELARHSSSTQTTYTVNDLSQYDFIGIMTSNGISTLNPVTIPYTLFKTLIGSGNTLQSAYSYGSTVLRGICNYIDDTHISIIANVSTGIMAIVYGIKIKALSSGGSSELPIATRDTLGGVKVGETMAINLDGTLNVKYVPHNYSLTEHIVGTWVDGKPLYEKTWLFTISASGSREFYSPVVVADADKYFITNAFAYYDDGSGANIGSSDTNTNYDFHISSFNLKTGRWWLHRGVGSANNVNITVRYTKTTD